jgi:Inner membrane component of T3SS, cytoplasmic domain
MSGRLWHVLLTIIALGIISLIPLSDLSAQNSYIINLSTPNTSGFPHITAYLDVHEPNGEFLHGLSIADVSIQENGASVPVAELVEQKPGVQFVMAISPGNSFTVRDAAGISRYEHLLQGILAGTWATRPVDRDDFSLLTMGGPLLTHSADPAQLHSVLETFQPDDTSANPNLEVLASALQLASDPTPRPGMERVILFVTPPQTSDVSLGLQSILSSANQQNIHILVWLVASPESLELPETDLLRNLAEQTHGSFFAFSHDEPIPDIETLLEPFRYIYQLGYDSQIISAGTQQVATQVLLNGETIASQTQSFELNLQSPKLVFLNLQAEITRDYGPQPASGTATVAGDLLPIEQLVNVQITFPDGYVHQLVRTSLYVDGTLVTENTKPPFEQLLWDLRPYTQDGTHTLRVEATDSLGMVGQTSETSVKINVPSTTKEVAVVLSQNRIILIGVTVLISALILILVLIVGGRIRPKPYPGQMRGSTSFAEKTRPRGYRERIRKLRDPVTQPIKISSNLPIKVKKRFQAWMGRFPWVKPKEMPVPTLAHLMPLVGTDEPTLSTPLHIKSDHVTLGSDPKKSDLVVADLSIEGVHAWIDREGKNFIIKDAGSVAGTWVNYEQVGANGANLVHADIIHVGKIGFRFTLSDPGTPRKVIVTPLEPER